MSAALKVATDKGDSEGIAILNRDLAMAADNAKKLQQQFDDGILGRDVLTKNAEAIAAFDTAFKGSTLERLEAERKMNADLLASDSLTAAQRHQIEAQVSAQDKAIRDAQYQHYSQMKDLEVTRAGENKAKVTSIRQEEYAFAVQTYGKESDQAIAALQRVEQARQAASKAGASGARDQLRATMEAAQAEVKAVQDATKLKIDAIDSEVKRHQISETEKVQQTIAALNEGLQAETDILEKERQLNGLKPAELQKILDQEKQVQRTYALDVQKIQEEAAQKSRQAWESMFSSMNSTITGQINGLINGTTNFKTAFRNILSSMTTDVIKFFVDWGLKAVENEAMQLLGIGAVQTAQTSADAAKVASGTMADAAVNASAMSSVLKSIGASASETFAGVFGFLSPVMGPAAAGPAAASEATVLGAAKGVASFAIGSWSLPGNMLANVHKGEMIVPAAQTPWVQSLVSNAAGGGSGGGEQHFHFHGAVMDAASVARAVAGAFNKNPSLRPRY